MAKQRPSVHKRQREHQKRQRDIKKAEKAAEKKERKLNRGLPDPVAPPEEPDAEVTPGADSASAEPIE